MYLVFALVEYCLLYEEGHEKLENHAATSAKGALSEKQLSLQLEEDLKKVCAELELVKTQATTAELAAQKNIQTLNAGLSNCRKGI